VPNDPDGSQLISFLLLVLLTPLCSVTEPTECCTFLPRLLLDPTTSARPNVASEHYQQRGGELALSHPPWGLAEARQLCQERMSTDNNLATIEQV
jgi:hypothetical protein